MTPDLLHELLQSGTEDWVSLDEAAWIVADGEFAPGSKDRVLGGLVEVFRDLLMIPGYLGETGFEDWPGTPEDWVVRLRHELDRLDWPPMGAGFWLRLTDKGRMHLAE